MSNTVKKKLSRYLWFKSGLGKKSRLFDFFHRLFFFLPLWFAKKNFFFHTHACKKKPYNMSDAFDDDDDTTVPAVANAFAQLQVLSCRSPSVVLVKDGCSSDEEDDVLRISRGKSSRVSRPRTLTATAAAVYMDEDVAPLRSAQPIGRGRGGGGAGSGGGRGARRATPGRPPKTQDPASELEFIRNEVGRLNGQVMRNAKMVNDNRTAIQRNLRGASNAAAASASRQQDLPMDDAEMERLSAEHDAEMRKLQALQLENMPAPVQVTLMQGNTASLAEYFRQARATGFVEAGGKGSAAAVVQGGDDESPFYASRLLGTQLQNPNARASDQTVIAKEGQLAAAQRAQTAVNQRKLHMTIAQIEARAFYDALREAQRQREAAAQRPGLKSSAAMRNAASSLSAGPSDENTGGGGGGDTQRCMQLEVPKLEVMQINDACKLPFQNFPPCANGMNCVGVTTLVPLLSGARSPLRAWCLPEEYELFLKQGIFPPPTAHGQCLPCMMNAFSAYIHQRRQSNTSGQLEQPPFTVHVERMGGFTRDSVLSCERLGSDFPDFRTNIFVPCVTQIQCCVENADTGKVVTQTVVVYGYEMSADVCYAGMDAGRNCRMVNVANPLHSAHFSLGSQLMQTPYETLAEMLSSSQIAQSYANGSKSVVYNVEVWLKALCCPFAETLHYIELAANVGVLYAALHPLIVLSLAEFGEGVTKLLVTQCKIEDAIPRESVKQSSLCVALMARHGLSLMLTTEWGIKTAEQVCLAYADSHKALLQFIVAKWQFNGVMPTNAALYGAALAGTPRYDVLEAFLRREKMYPEMRSLDVTRSADELHKVTRTLVINHRTNGFSHMKHVALRFLPNGTLTNMTTGRNVCVLFDAVEALCSDDRCVFVVQFLFVLRFARLLADFFFLRQVFTPFFSSFFHFVFFLGS